MLGRSLLDLLLAAATHVRSSMPKASKPQVGLRRRAEALIEMRLNQSLGVQDLCDALDATRGGLFAAFRADGGVQSYVRRLRLERARAALADLERGEPIGTIALRLGFCDAPHLTRLFRERYGMSPREYRHLVAQDQAD